MMMLMLMMMMMVMRMVKGHEQVSAIIAVWRWQCRDRLNNRLWKHTLNFKNISIHFTYGNTSLLPDTATTAGICGQLVSTADSGLRSVMTVPRQRSRTEHATAAHQKDDARQDAHAAVRPAAALSSRRGCERAAADHQKDDTRLWWWCWWWWWWSKCMSTFRTSHFIHKLTRKMPQAKPADHTLRELAQSKCTSTCHKSHFIHKLNEIYK